MTKQDKTARWSVSVTPYVVLLTIDGQYHQSFYFEVGITGSRLYARNLRKAMRRLAPERERKGGGK